MIRVQQISIISITAFLICLFQVNYSFAKKHIVWETIEVVFESTGEYSNPYTDVNFWVELEGPGFKRKVYGFWDGDNTFKVRIIANKEGDWKWRSFSTPYDAGLSGKSGSFKARKPNSKEIEKNPNFHGIIKTNPAFSHSFIYDDGTPFFFLADTWWAASTWRYPFKGGISISDDYVPSESNWSFEGGLSWLKKHGYNSIALISCFPNWKVDDYGHTIRDNNGVVIRAGSTWGKAPNGEKVKDMHDEYGNMPFMFPGKSQGKEDACANYDKINPEYWQSLDKKMQYMWENGFVPYLETIRRDQLPAWINYHDFNESFSRFLNYIRARYGTYNFIYSLVHYDTKQRGVTPELLDNVFSYYYEAYGDMPFGQPVTAMMRNSTLKLLGHIDEAPYLTCHCGGNTNRSHGILQEMSEMFNAHPSVPVFNNEPYYPLVDLPWGRAGDVEVEPNSELDNYFGRSHMYSNFFSGAYSGYVFGTGAFGGDSYGEPPYVGEPTNWPKIWDALKIDAFKKGIWYRKFIDSLEGEYQSLIPSHEDLSAPRTDTETLMDWSYMLKGNDNHLVLLYFERNAQRQTISSLIPNSVYKGMWFNPRNGEWSPVNTVLKTNENGVLNMPKFPEGSIISEKDWVVKLTYVE